MPRACAAIVIRVWSSVRSAILKPSPSPSAPISRDAGISQLSKYSSLVGEPLMPSLCSERETLVGVLEYERRDPVGARRGIGDRHHRVVLRHPGVGDPALHPVTSSITMATEIASAPAPPYASGIWMACRSALTSASYTSQGNSDVRSTSAARGAILSSARGEAREAARALRRGFTG